MKNFLLFLSFMLLIDAPLLAQKPVQDTIPQLKEWWRADNMQYAKYGMTWLDNFYQGKGALVVWTPQGVKTWLLRFPGDTMNVFTWEKGSSNIKTGDFNGDGATDYIDENGYIYEGIKNGEPPKAETQNPVKNFSPWIVTDINGDGKDDMIKPGLPGSVLLGKSNLGEIINEKMVLPQLDSNNTPIVAYMVGAKEMRIVCTHTYWTNNVKFPFQTVYKDGLRLVRVWWDGNGFKSEIVDEFSKDCPDGKAWGYGLKLLQHSPSTVYLIITHRPDSITVFNLSKDKFDITYTVKNIRPGVMGTLTHSIDSDTIVDYYAEGQTPDGQRNFIVYSGDVAKGIHPIYEFVTVQMTALISVGDVTGDGQADLALSNEYDFTSAKTKYRFSILTPKDSTSSVVEEQETMPMFSIHVVAPMPVKKLQAIPLNVLVPKEGNYSLTLFDSGGRIVSSQTIQLHAMGEHSINFDISSYLIASGAYTLQLTGQGRRATCSLIIQ